MKKLIALLLAVLLVLALAACAGEPEETTPPTDPSQSDNPSVPTDPEPVIPEVTYPNGKFDPEICAPLIGSWKTPVVLDGSLMNMPEFDGSVAFDLLFTFQDSGRYTISADETTVLAAIVEYEDLLTDYMLDGFYAKFAAESKLKGMSESEIEEDWANGRLQAAEAQVEAFVAGVGLTARFASVITHGDYYVQNETLFLSDVGSTYEAYTFLVRNELLYFANCSEPTKYMNLWLKFPLPLWPDDLNYEDHPAEDLTVSLGPEHPTVTVPPITDPTDPLPTVPSGFIPIPTVTGGNYIPTTPTEPTVTVPDVTDPTVTDPVVTTPVPTDPTVTVPPVTKPVVTKPVITEPTDPVVTAPPATKPVVTKPVATEPTDPVVTVPPVTKPVVTEPVVTIPPVTKPPVTEPVATLPPIVVEPDVTDPDVTEPPMDPDATETLPPVPTVTAPDPVVTEPTGTEPPVTDPDELPLVPFPTDPDDGPIDTNVDWVVH